MNKTPNAIYETAYTALENGISLNLKTKQICIPKMPCHVFARCSCFTLYSLFIHFDNLSSKKNSGLLQ